MGQPDSPFVPPAIVGAIVNETLRLPTVGAGVNVGDIVKTPLRLPAVGDGVTVRAAAGALVYVPGGMMHGADPVSAQEILA